jgi:hypothetical protein
MISAGTTEVRTDVQAGSRPRAAGPLDLGVPLTDSILERLPGPRWLLISLWAGAVLVTPLAVIGAKRLSEPGLRIDPVGELGSQAVLSYVVALLLVGVARLVDHAAALQPDLSLLTVDALQPTESTRPTESARPWNVVGPLSLSALIVLVASGSSWRINGALPTIVVLPFLALAAVPVMTFVWTYVRLLVGLDRLGRARLGLQPFPQDRSLGLGPVGSLAFSGFALLVGAAVPTLLATTGNPTTFVITLVILGVNIPIFFRSMWRLHRQMSGAKIRYVAQARSLYAEAYAPLRIEPTLSILRTQAPALDAARALEERAERIQVWPINDGLIAIIGFIVAGVASGIVVRFIVTAAHL